MTNRTYTLPSGDKVRPQSQRRFVVVSTFIKGRPFVQYRTDVLQRALARATSQDWIIDQVEGDMRSAAFGVHPWLTQEAVKAALATPVAPVTEAKFYTAG